MLKAHFGKVKNKFQYATAINLTHNKERLSAKPFESLPGPSKLELLRAFMPGGRFYQKSFIEFNRQLRTQYGDIFLVPGLFGKRDILFTYNPKDYQQVFRTEGLYPIRRGLDIIQYHRKELRKDVFKHAVGLVAEQGENWSKFRSAVNPVMMNPKSITMYITKTDHVAKNFISCIKRIRDPNSKEVPENFQEYIKYWTIDSVGLIALDTDLNMLNNSEAHPAAKILIDNMEEFFQLLLELDMQPSMWKIMATPKFKKIIKILDLMNELSLTYVNKALEGLHKEERLASKDPLTAATMAMDIFIAGVDTTTSALTACLLTLATNPKQQTKLRQEILAILPDKNSVLNQENMRNLPYLRACIKESLRLYPVATGNFRTTGQDTILSGYRVPANTDISMTAQLLLKDPKYFEQPNKFLPERWLRSQGLLETEKVSAANKGDPFVYLPFGFGPRICIGNRIVDLELETVLARLLRNFEIKFDYPTDDMFKTNIINIPAKPLKFRFCDLI
ncbi:putative cytochrome P450 12a5, mitochondrial [Lucilia cuprina]|uniref:Putative cytochrome P450 12a5, mitochondrial n=1 Tax=Lucilia cuprina TaxID=7375 RepID=A0A0L0BYA5_LUCCU|nr:mitochondrial, Probable cytochrome P450 12a5 [Lucilia cuprina]KNC25017.1 putative cytochrome P450 12a5, mitochondrial [Lucilia cuprina]